MKVISQIGKAIKKANTIVIARHIGPDLDSVGSANALRESLRLKFPHKNIYSVGSPSRKLAFLGEMDKVREEDFEHDLLIVLDTPNVDRIDGVDISLYKQVIKIDHHPFIEQFGEIEWIDDTQTSCAGLIYQLLESLKFPINELIAKYIFVGIVADTNRFMYIDNDINVMQQVHHLLTKYPIQTAEIYRQMYTKNQTEWKFMSYLISNLIINKSGLAYIFITDEELKKNKVDTALPGNMINDLGDIEGVEIKVFFVEDKKINKIRVNIRSNNTTINKVAEKYNGGGHKLAAGAKLNDEADVKKMIQDLESLLIP